MGMSGGMPHDTKHPAPTDAGWKEVVMRKFVTIGTVALLATMGIVTGVSADAGEPREPVDGPSVTAERVSDLSASMDRLDRSSERISMLLERQAAMLSRVNCTTVQCLNEKLTDLTRFAKRTAKRLATLDAAWVEWYGEWDNCVPVYPVTQYGGFMYSETGETWDGMVTGLDQTFGEDPVTQWVLVWTCDVTT
jgi:hypothetical protein